MAIILNTWIEKARKKVIEKKPTAMAYERSTLDTDPLSSTKPTKRFSTAARSFFARTLRGVRR